MRVAFSERELDVMAVLWEHGPSTAAEVRTYLETDLAYNTVLSFLRVLEGKGHVGHVLEGKAHRYIALVDRGQAGQSAITRLLDTIFGGSAELLLVHLVRDKRVDVAEIARLRRVLDEQTNTPRPGAASPGKKTGVRMGRR
jgi:BlaI family penicillinase repressor